MKNKKPRTNFLFSFCISLLSLSAQAGNDGKKVCWEDELGRDRALEEVFFFDKNEPVQERTSDDEAVLSPEVSKEDQFYSIQELKRFRLEYKFSLLNQEELYRGDSVTLRNTAEHDGNYHVNRRNVRVRYWQALSSIVVKLNETDITAPDIYVIAEEFFSIATHLKVNPDDMPLTLSSQEILLKFIRHNEDERRIGLGLDSMSLFGF
jgi:hypothetical protein